MPVKPVSLVVDGQAVAEKCDVAAVLLRVRCWDQDDYPVSQITNPSRKKRNTVL